MTRRIEAGFTPPMYAHSAVVAQTQACVLAIAAVGIAGISFGLLLLGPVTPAKTARLVPHHAELVLRVELP